MSFNRLHTSWHSQDSDSTSSNEPQLFSDAVCILYASYWRRFSWDAKQNTPQQCVAVYTNTLRILFKLKPGWNILCQFSSTIWCVDDILFVTIFTNRHVNTRKLYLHFCNFSGEGILCSNFFCFSSFFEIIFLS